MVEHALHFWRAVLTPEEHPASVEYHAGLPSFSEFAANTNVVDENPKLSLRKTVLDKSAGSGGLQARSHASS